MIQKDYDVVVAGSGAAGLTTAIRTASAGLRTLVVEAAEQFGGTTAISGGRVWVPANGTAANTGDSPQRAKTYLAQIFDQRWPEFVDTFVDNAQRMRTFIEAHSFHRFAVCPSYPDYHPALEGSTAGGRCFDMEIIYLRDLVDEAARVREAPGYSPIQHSEWEQWRYPDKIDTALLKKRYDDGGRTGGFALAAALLDGAVRSGCDVQSGTRLVDVLRTDSAVSSVAIETSSGIETISTRAVVLATGGFDANEELRNSLLPIGLSVSAAAPSNTGTALEIAERLGLPVENVHDGWWMPMAMVPGETVDGQPHPRGLVRERGVPRSVIINGDGKRFTDEASPYNEFGKAMHMVDENGHTPNREAYLIFDEKFRRRYPFPGLTKSGPLPEHVLSAPTVSGLARQIGVDTNGLCETIRRWNSFSTNGRDRDFHRGENVYDLYYGDPWASGNPCLGRIDEAPYYATRIYSGSIGSKGGITTDTSGHVLGFDGVVSGLFAVGNAAAFWTGDGYPGPGATLAVGMVMGLQAGDAIVMRSAR
ncbi:FAD-dependent oxidoreductase [Paramicrobacterium chengjingii]|uniref:FAD-dependent oxidoreductase n=1 Tax=Paramicrobacterium chengjingii TaxID=2769067 RepID=UPI0014215C7C|nr:FAD-dependent oxidoreductase [Microbacterium chengjingii]